MDHWYFAYGSNLLAEQMIARIGLSLPGDQRPRIARLRNHRLAFNMLGDDGEIYANIIESTDDTLGVLYRCGSEALEKLDEYEEGYDRREVIVIDEQGLAAAAFVYVARPDRVTRESQPGNAYLGTIVSGARCSGLPEEYIQAIEARANGAGWR